MWFCCSYPEIFFPECGEPIIKPEPPKSPIPQNIEFIPFEFPDILTAKHISEHYLEWLESRPNNNNTKTFDRSSIFLVYARVAKCHKCH